MYLKKIWFNCEVEFSEKRFHTTVYEKVVKEIIKNKLEEGLKEQIGEHGKINVQWLATSLE